ncbi:Gfo/Idh/MocA family oxidoreductase [Dermabacteraceae bacterium TAE3-ERU27]|nr:Gfo/Idh/MocA family oxidoreductase [Dermabacteraceae bacterium TAE3-ERU27]
MKIALMSLAHPRAIDHAERLLGRPDVELLLADPLEEGDAVGEMRGYELAEHFEVELVGSYDEMFAWGPDAVIICEKPSRRAAAVKMAAEHGVHVLVEQPLALSVSEAREAVQACAEAGVKLQVVAPLRFSRAVEAARKAIASGAVGEVLGITATHTSKLPLTERAWFGEAAEGGCIGEHLAPVIDVASLLTGRDLAAVGADVYVTTNRIVHGASDGLDVPTGALVDVVPQDGPITAVDCSWTIPDTAPTDRELTVQVMGSEGTIDVEPYAQHLAGFERASAKSFWIPFGTDFLAAALDEFLGLVDGTVSEGRAGAEIALQGARIAETALYSATTPGIEQVLADDAPRGGNEEETVPAEDSMLEAETEAEADSLSPEDAEASAEENEADSTMAERPETDEEDADVRED